MYTQINDLLSYLNVMKCILEKEIGYLIDVKFLSPKHTSLHLNSLKDYMLSKFQLMYIRFGNVHQINISVAIPPIYLLNVYIYLYVCLHHYTDMFLILSTCTIQNM